jgi:hypothetical protein
MKFNEKTDDWNDMCMKCLSTISTASCDHMVKQIERSMGLTVEEGE